MKKVLCIFLAVFLVGCAAKKPKSFVEVYNTAVQGKESVAIVKAMDFDALKKKVNLHLKERGYIKVIKVIPQNGFMVLAKDLSIYGEEKPDAENSYKIILKYTNVVEGKIRVDLVNGAEKSSIKNKVDQDISILEILIKGD